MVNGLSGGLKVGRRIADRFAGGINLPGPAFGDTHRPEGFEKIRGAELRKNRRGANAMADAPHKMPDPVDPLKLRREIYEEIVRDWQATEAKRAELLRRMRESIFSATGAAALAPPAPASPPELDRNLLRGVWNLNENGGWHVLALDTSGTFVRQSWAGDTGQWGNWEVGEPIGGHTLLNFSNTGHYPAMFYGVLGPAGWREIHYPATDLMEVTAFSDRSVSFASGGVMTRNADVALPYVSKWIADRICMFQIAEDRNKNAGAQAVQARSAYGQVASAIDSYINSGAGRYR
jgi:hypothetical protein